MDISGKSSHLVKSLPLLNECCAQSVSCRLYLLHSGQMMDATFRLIESRQLVLQVLVRHRDEMLQPEALCCITFPYQSSLLAFLGCIKKIRDNNEALEVIFDLPSELTTTNLRSSFRVPVMREAGVGLTIRLADGSRIQGDVLNVSESGLEVNLPVDDGRLMIDAELQLELSVHDDRLELPAIVRRRQQSRRALQFALVTTPEARQRLAALQRIVRSLEQIWLKRRLV